MIEWAVTVEDPTTWTRPWRFARPLTMNDHEPVFEFACHEGNYAVPNILSAARAAERAVDSPTRARYQEPSHEGTKARTSRKG